MQLLKLQRREIEMLRRTRYEGGPSLLYFLKPVMLRQIPMAALLAFMLFLSWWSGSWSLLLPFVTMAAAAIVSAAAASFFFFLRFQLLWNVLEDIIQWDRVDELLD